MWRVVWSDRSGQTYYGDRYRSRGAAEAVCERIRAKGFSAWCQQEGRGPVLDD
jgi:hypothetical protein